ncbi:FkbM family methyltransferase [Niabella aquatica]
MILARMLYKSVLYIYYLIKFKSSKVAFNFAHYNLPPKYAGALSVNKGLLVFNKTGNAISKDCLANYRGEYIKLVCCLNDSRVTVTASTKKNFTVLVEGIYLNINSLSNLFTLYELYFETLYNILNLNTDIVVVDIGMNVGFASLFFAKKLNPKIIYAYEPFQETYKEALRNFDLNPALKSKICPNNYGLSDYEDTISAPQMQSGDGGASVNKDILKNNHTQHLPKTSVKIKDIRKEVQRIITANPENTLLFKIDCEGEEYPIFEKLKTSDIFEKTSAFIIEWHLKGFDTIASVLSRHGFKILSLPRPDNISGMLYAFK